MTISFYKLIQSNVLLLRDLYLRKTLTNIFYWTSERLLEGVFLEGRCRFSLRKMGVNLKAWFRGRDAFT